MQPIDVVLIDLPGVLSDILRSVLDREPDIRVRGQLRDCRALLEGAERIPAQVVIVGGETSDLPAACRALLDARVQTKVLTVAGDGRDASLYELRPHRLPLGELSPDRLLDAVRTARSTGDL